MLTKDPVLRVAKSPAYGSYPSNRWVMTASPAVAVRIWFRKPIRPREGMRNSMCCKSPLASITWSMPLRIMTNSVALPAVASGTSMTRCSKGSCCTPSMSLNKT